MSAEAPAISPEDFVDHVKRWEFLWMYRHLRDLLPRLNVDCVWDVGANRGQFGNFLRVFGKYEGPLLSFEPVSEPYGFMVKHIAQRGDEDWTVQKIALGAREEEKTINIMENSGLSSFRDINDYGAATFGKPTASTGQELVTVKTLDSLALDGRAFLKLDVQGWELEVLRGAENSLRQVVGIAIELSLQHIYDGEPGHREVLAYLEERGFVLSGFFPVSHDRQFQLVEADCVMVRPEEVR